MFELHSNLIHGHQRYTPLYSGREVDIFNLAQRDIVIEDIAHALSQLPMYGGHVKYHYSVAQHSVARLSAFDYTVRSSAETWLGEGLYAKIAMSVLLYDAPAAYVGYMPTLCSDTMAYTMLMCIAHVKDTKEAAGLTLRVAQLYNLEISLRNMIFDRFGAIYDHSSFDAVNQSLREWEARTLLGVNFHSRQPRRLYSLKFDNVEQIDPEYAEELYLNRYKWLRMQLETLPCAEAPVQPPHNGQAGGVE